jgi:hypothetical protein
MATAKDADFFTNAIKYLNHFCSWVPYHQLKPLPEGI